MRAIQLLLFCCACYAMILAGCNSGVDDNNTGNGQQQAGAGAGSGGAGTGGAAGVGGAGTGASGDSGQGAGNGGADSGAAGQTDVDGGDMVDGGEGDLDGGAGDSDAGADARTYDTPGTGDCCEEHTEPGCEDADLQSCVCDKLPECCTDTWDLPCALIVQQKYCEPGVRECVCGLAPDGWEQTQCCESQWTNFCNETAIIKCGAKPGC